MSGKPKVNLTIDPNAITPRTPSEERVVTSINLPIETRDNAARMAKALRSTVSRLATVALDSMYADFVRKYPDKAQASIRAEG